MSFILLLSVFGVPSVGVKVTRAATLARPCRLSRRFALRFGLTVSSMSPAAWACVSAPFTLLFPASSTSPGSATITVSFAFPRGFLRTLPKLNSFDGGTDRVSTATPHRLVGA
jgi:hypothetical protein